METPDWRWTDDADMPSEAELDALVARAARPEPLPLSARQLETLTLLAAGWRFSDIARKRGSTVSAEKDAAREVRQKLAAKTVPHAVAIAFRAGLIT